ncbi:MAG: hypothetical protein AB7L09_00055 [Nitrospira sp.]
MKIDSTFPNGHDIPVFISADMMNADGSYTGVCKACGATMKVTPNVVGSDGTLRRRIDHMDEAINLPCPR